MYLDYFNTNTPILKAKRGELLTIDPNNIDSIKAFQDEAVRLGLMKQEDLIGRGYGSYGPKTKTAYAHYQKGTTPTTTAATIKPGAYYLSYPSHMIPTKGQGINLGKRPLGHAGVVIVGQDGSVTQYDYGRYNTSTVFGTRNEPNRGNWMKTDRGRVTIGGDYSTLLNAVYDNAGKDASENVRLTYAHDADPQKVIDYINNDANSVDRAIYGIGPFAKEKWEAVKNGELGFGEAVREMCTAKGCATSAYNAVSAGVPFVRRAAGNVRNMFHGAVSAAKELFSRDRDGVGASVYFSPRNRERALQDMGYQTYDSNDYIDHD